MPNKHQNGHDNDSRNLLCCLLRAQVLMDSKLNHKTQSRAASHRRRTSMSILELPELEVHEGAALTVACGSNVHVLGRTRSLGSSLLEQVGSLTPLDHLLLFLCA